MGKSNKVRHWFWLFIFKRTILLLIHHQFLQFWYQCIKKTSIYHIIGNFPKIAAATHGKLTKSMISSNPQSWPAWVTFELRHYVQLHCAQPQLDIIPRRHLVYRWTGGIFHFLSSKVTHAGQLCGLEEIVDFVRFFFINYFIVPWDLWSPAASRNLVTFERALLVEYTSQIWSLYHSVMVQKL